jgi:PAS domain S-box-containing protein
MIDPSLHDARILIVDDQEANLTFLEDLLREGGYSRWRSVRDPLTAASICAEFRPDLILLDLIMPHLDGFGVLERLRPFLDGEEYLPVLVLTIDLTAESKRRALASGAKDFLSKPLDAIEVLLRVKNLLETRFLYQQLRRQSDERIREQAALIDQANDAILVCDLAGRITFWSRGAERLYGWPAAEVLGQSVIDVLFAAPPAELLEANRMVMVTGRWEGELRQLTASRRDVIVASRWTLLNDAHGRPKSKLIINTDVTEKKKTEDKLLRAQRLENIGRLAGGIAHDLNNVLAPLTGGIDLLQHGDTDPARQSLLETMRASVQRGSDLVRQVLTFARGLGGHRQPVYLGSIIHELATLFRHTFLRTINVVTEVAADLWPVNADATQMHQVLTNLCVNARDAMPEGGELRVSARNERLSADEAARVQGLPPGNYVVLEVQDTGTGIPAAVRGKIFEPFFTTKEVGKGTGLGLSTSLDIVRDHGGRIVVESKEGQGARFLTYLPAQAAPDAAPNGRDRHELLASKGELVLVVDDEEAMLQIARLTLTAAGYRVITAHNGAEAVTLYAKQPREIGVVLTDLVMPVMDGAATIQALRRLNPAVKIVVCSGLGTGAEASQSIVPRMHGFLPKPCSVDTLLTMVRSALDA